MKYRLFNNYRFLFVSIRCLQFPSCKLEKYGLHNGRPNTDFSGNACESNTAPRLWRGQRFWRPLSSLIIRNLQGLMPYMCHEFNLFIIYQIFFNLVCEPFSCKNITKTLTNFCNKFENFTILVTTYHWISFRLLKQFYYSDYVVFRISVRGGVKINRLSCMHRI